MAKNKPQKKEKDKENLLTILGQHYSKWTDDNERRQNRDGGWNDVTDAYWGVLPDDWPYDSKVVDPRIRTTLIEKNARLINNKLRGKLTPRESSDPLKASILNTILDFQWDTAAEGGSMVEKVSMADMDTRLYGTKFILVPWREKTNSDGEVTFEGNEFIPLDIRDCGIDFAAKDIRDAIWFQHRTWEYIDELEKKTDVEGDSIFKNLDKIRRKLNNKEFESRASSKRRNEWRSRVKDIQGLEDRVGEDMAFPMIEIVTEYRKDRWITFAPEFNVVVRDIKNPNDHGQIPVAQLTYYKNSDDPYGESEVESVLDLWLAIQSVVCGYLDEATLKMRPPLKIVEGAARMETIEYGPEAQWLVTNPDAVTEMRTGGDSIKFFRNTYPALVSAFNVAMGDASQGVSAIDPTSQEKTATEIRYTEKQQNTRDQRNQLSLSEMLKDVMMMWVSNIQQFMFKNPEKEPMIMRILGEEQFDMFKRNGLDAYTVKTDDMKTIQEIIALRNGDVSDVEIKNMFEAAKQPKHEVEMPDGTTKPKMEISEDGNSAELLIEEADVQGKYDYIPDIRSMSTSHSERLTLARQRAIQSFTSPVVLESLQKEGYRPKFKELLSSDLEDAGLTGAERFFEQISEQEKQIQQQEGQQDARTSSQGITERAQKARGSVQNKQVGRLPELSPPNAGGSVPQQMG